MQHGLAEGNHGMVVRQMLILFRVNLTPSVCQLLMIVIKGIGLLTELSPLKMNSLHAKKNNSSLKQLWLYISRRSMITMMK